MSIQPILIGGEWRRGRGDVVATRYPADDSVTAEIAQANVADVDEAIEAADAAWRRPNWRDLISFCETRNGRSHQGGTEYNHSIQQKLDRSVLIQESVAAYVVMPVRDLFFKHAHLDQLIVTNLYSLCARCSIHSGFA